MHHSERSLPKPSLLGLKASFGFGDRLGLAAPGHIAACLKGRLAPIFAQQSVRELERTGRDAEDVMKAAQEGILQEGWAGPWGADGDHLKTREDVDLMARAGFCFFTIDPSAFVNNHADGLTGTALEAAAGECVNSGAFESLREVDHLYLNKTVELAGCEPITFDSREALHRAVVNTAGPSHTPRIWLSGLAKRIPLRARKSKYPLTKPRPPRVLMSISSSPWSWPGGM